jgi:cytosine/adenosine deaminase-related metal-dependent hydrolase
MPRIHRAEWVLPIHAPPIQNGWVEVDRGRIVGVGGPPGPRRPGTTHAEPEPRTKNHETGTAILPALINAHTHLELSWMKGCVPPGNAMPEWAARLMQDRQAQGTSQAEHERRRSAMVAAMEEARSSGTGLVGDVCNALEAWEPLADSGLAAIVFFELLGFRADDPVGLVADARVRLAALRRADGVRAAVVPHAPYSVSPGLFRAIAASAGEDPIAVHLAESPEEIRFLREGTGPWRDLLDRIGAWAPEWVPPACGPVEYVERLGLLNDRLIAVHGVQLEDDELRRLAARGATLVTCPRSNRWTGAGTPPIRRFYESGVRVAIGTDSLASVDDLNLFNEMAEVRRLAPDVAARRILRSATLDGAAALGFGSDLGSIAVGKRAALITVRLPPGPLGPEDVEEYLLRGIQPADTAWLESD